MKIEQVAQHFAKATDCPVAIYDFNEKAIRLLGVLKEDDLAYFDFEEVKAYAELHRYTSSSKCYSVCTTRNHFLYSIVFLGDRDRALLAGPVRQKEMPNRNTIFLSASSPTNREKTEKVFHTLLMLSNVQFAYLGEHLSLLCEYWETNDSLPEMRSAISEDGYRQIIKSEEKYSTTIHSIEEQVHAPFFYFVELKKALVRGDLNVLNQLNFDLDLPGDLLIEGDVMRSLKNNSISGIGWIVCLSIENGAPYEQTLTLADKCIRRIEGAKHPNEIMILTKESFEALIRAHHTSRNKAYSWPVTQVLQYIRKNYKEYISLEKLAAHTKLSAVYLSKLIKKETGRSLSDHINRTRIDESKQYLKHTNLPMSDVSQLVGYNYQNYFNKCFKAMEGIPPIEYRKRFGMVN
jgi:AraC-like DNA-binding protein